MLEKPDISWGLGLLGKKLTVKDKKASPLTVFTFYYLPFTS